MLVRVQAVVGLSVSNILLARETSRRLPTAMTANAAHGKTQIDDEQHACVTVGKHSESVAYAWSSMCGSV